MSDLQPMLIAGRWVLPQLAALPNQLEVRVSIGMNEAGELLGSSVAVLVKAGDELLAQLSAPDPTRKLASVSTGGATAYAEFLFDNPRSLIPTELKVTMDGHLGTFDISDIVPVTTAPQPPKATSLRITLVRPDDLVNLDIEALNLKLDSSNPKKPTLAVSPSGADAWLAVRFPPQTTIEEAFYESGGPEQKLGAGDVSRKKTPPSPIKSPVPAGDAAARMSGNSRLVFRVPAAARIPFTIEGLLDWSNLELQVTPIADVAPNAAPPAEALAIRAPGPTESTIEMPFRLHLSPGHSVNWDHATGPVSHQGRIELWHTRLALRNADGSSRRTDEQHTIPLRAIWSPDYDPSKLPDPGDLGPLDTIAAMSAADRDQIVILTSAFRGYAADAYHSFVPQPVQASLLMLSPLGGWLRSFGMWNPPYTILPRFRQEVLNPLTQVFELHEGGVPRARTVSVGRALLRTQEIAPTNTANATIGPVNVAGRDQLLTTVGPNIVMLPLYNLGQQLDLSQWMHIASQGRDHYVRIVYEGKLKELGHRASLVKVTERRFEPSPDTGAPVAYLRQYMYLVVREPEKDYTQEGLQQGGRAMPLKKVRLTTLVTPKIDYPYIAPASITARSFWVMVGGKDFLFHGIAEDVEGNKIDFAKPLVFVPNSEEDLASVDAAFNAVENRERRAAAIPAQKVTFAPANAGNQNTTFVGLSLNFENEGISRETFFKPRLFKAEVRIPSVEQIAGADSRTTIRLAQRYLDHGFGDPSNKTDLFAEVVTQNSSGVLESGGLDVGFTADRAGGFATPNLAIKNLTRGVGPLGGDATQALANQFDPAQVFKKGLATLFGVFDLSDLLPSGSADKSAPKMQVTRVGTTVVTEFDWISPVQAAPVASAAIVEFHENADTQLRVHGEFRKELGAPMADAFTLQGDLNHFNIEFFSVLQINFSLFTFKAQSGKKTDVNVKLDDATPIEFIGDLEFVEGLRKLIPPGVFGDGVSIDLIQNPLGVKVGLGLTLPPAEVGVFALKNISFSAGLTIPFLDGKPIVEFAFARRDNPFLLAVALLGGGGFFRIELDTDGIRMLEASFEFGAVAAIDLGVASGEVHIMAGIYFKMEKKAIAALGNKEVMVSLLSGYLRCGGKLTVLGLVSVSVEFYLCFVYIVETKKAYGRATVTVCVEIAGFSKSIELTVERGFGGEGGDPTFGQLMDSSQAWSKYAGAFA